MRASFVTLLAALGLAFAGAAVTATPASAVSCDSDTGGCFPGSGYTGTFNFNCGGLAANILCYQPGTTTEGNGQLHTFGWASADYDGGGSTVVGTCISGGNGSTICQHRATGTNIVRMCVYNGCNDDNDDINRTAAIFTQTAHTIYGSAKA